MKFTALFTIACLTTTVVAQEAYDFSRFATRELYEEIAPSARRAVRDELVLRALHHVKQQAQDHANLVARTYDILDNALYRRWGSGKYLIDDHIYHDEVKPEILKKMRELDGFTKKCGKNPDFDVDRKGTVFPSSRPGIDKNGLCTKKAFSIDMHNMLMEVQARHKSESSDSESSDSESTSSKSGHKKTQDTTRDKSGNKPGHNKPGHNKPGHNKPGHNKPGHNKPGHKKRAGFY